MAAVGFSLFGLDNFGSDDFFSWACSIHCKILAGSLASNHWLWIVPFTLAVLIKNVFRYWQMSPGKQNHSLLRSSTLYRQRHRFLDSKILGKTHRKTLSRQRFVHGRIFYIWSNTIWSNPSVSGCSPVKSVYRELICIELLLCSKCLTCIIPLNLHVSVTHDEVTIIIFL